MKKLYFVFALTFLFSFLYAQDEGYKFTDEIRLQTTSVKDQYASGTCWIFSGLSFFETEYIRKTGVKPEEVPDLSEMYFVYKAYIDKAQRYIRMHGKTNFGPGGGFPDILYLTKHYGLIPEEYYKGLNYGFKKHRHGEMDKVLEGYITSLKDYGENLRRGMHLSTAWLNGFKGILDAYLGVPPEKFQYKGKEYTPQSFATDFMQINPDDYVCITSYTHHPFYTKFPLEVPDNWLWADYYNVPIDDLMRIIDYALEHGYSVAWAADVSENGFSHKYGVAVVPDIEFADMTQTERDRWEKLPREEKYNLTKPGKEKSITQEMRQEQFDNYLTTDDHGMHIIGRAHDQNGTKYYIVKNSWGTDNNPYGGYIYASKAYVMLKTMDIMVHKDAIPKDIRKKLNIK